MYRICVICSSFNKAEQLRRNIWCMAHQDYEKPFAYVVIDDGSVDHTQEVITEAFGLYPELKLVNILTDRKAKGHFGGQGIVYNIGLRFAEELGVEYIIFTGGDILVPTYGITRHIALHESNKIRAWAVISQNSHDPNTDHQLIWNNCPDVLCGPRQYFIRPDRESIGNNVPVLSAIPDRYDWQPPEKLMSQIEALTIEPGFEQTPIYIGYTGQVPLDIHHSDWPTWQSCKLEHWLTIGGWNEVGEGHFWEDWDIRHRMINYDKYLRGQGHPGFSLIVHPDVCIYHQPHPRQLSFDNKALFEESWAKHPFIANLGKEWGRAKHEVVRARI